MNRPTALGLALAALLTLGGLARPQAAQAAPTARAGTWAFCGVHPDAPGAQRSAYSLSFSGVDATFGPCMPPDWTSYTPSNPGARYINPDAYARLVTINANAGMRTVVYDARLWSDNPAERATAVEFWRPQASHIAAWDMGDEFDPATTEWPILVHRWQTIGQPLGIAPFTNHLAQPGILAQALTDLPGPRLSFDSYTEDAQGIPQDTLKLAAAFGPLTDDMMCAVNALPFADHAPTWLTTARNMWLMRLAGCDSFLIFGGMQPYGPTLTSTDPQFGPSLVNSGWPTALALGVLLGSL